jgi:hypothetical protein
MINKKFNTRISPIEQVKKDNQTESSFNELNSTSLVIEKKNQKHSKESKPKVKSKRVTLITRGVSYNVPISTFEKLPESRLGKLKSLIEDPKQNDLEESLDDLCESYDLKTNTFYFNGDPTILNMILNYLNTSKFHMDETVCGNLDMDDLNYWKVDEELLDGCCRHKFFQGIDDINATLKDEENVIKSYVAANNFGTYFFPKARAKVWQIIESKETRLSKVNL